MSQKFQHIFFDLDHTLWDFETNSRLALEEIFQEVQLLEKGIPSFEQFHKAYLPINDYYWFRYHNKLCTKEETRTGRFYDTLKSFGVEDNSLAQEIAARYVSLSPYKTALHHGALEVVSRLSETHELHIITNGFSEVQRIKIQESGLAPFFKHLIISEEVGVQKPQPEIFHHLLSLISASKRDCVMVGDNFNTDIEGARNAGIAQMYFNPHKKPLRGQKPTYTIHHLQEVANIVYYQG
jgi:putative hydrolase of the HAD superfamily